MNSFNEDLVEAVAEEMWILVRKDSDKDWAWCNKNDSMFAGELRYRARRCLLFGASKEVEKKNEVKVTELDLRFKEAFIVADLKMNQ